MSTMTNGRTYDLVIHGARADDPALRAAAEWARTIGHRIRAHVTWEAGDARRFAALAAERGTDAVLAAGGDGTINEVVNGLAGSSVPLGILPLGTANDFARQTGIPADPQQAMALVVEGEPVTVDLGMLNGRAFLNVSSAGYGAETTAETGAVAKGMLGPLAYALTGVRKLAGELEPKRARLCAPGVDREIEFMHFAVGARRRAVRAGAVGARGMRGAARRERRRRAVVAHAPGVLDRARRAAGPRRTSAGGRRGARRLRSEHAAGGWRVNANGAASDSDAAPFACAVARVTPTCRRPSPSGRRRVRAG
jgi:hypothetical protein